MKLNDVCVPPGRVQSSAGLLAGLAASALGTLAGLSADGACFGLAASPARLCFFSVADLKSVSYQPLPDKRNAGMTIQKALTINAVPGYSEHQTGCAIDLTAPGVPAADGSFARSKAFAWMQSHAAEYGFHLSFPPGNKYGYEYEPWHWRYIAGSASAHDVR